MSYYVSANIQEAIVADKKRILQRLKQRRISQAHDSDTDSESEEKRIVAPPRPALIVCGGRLFDQITAQVNVVILLTEHTV